MTSLCVQDTVIVSAEFVSYVTVYLEQQTRTSVPGIQVLIVNVTQTNAQETAEEYAQVCSVYRLMLFVRFCCSVTELFYKFNIISNIINNYF